MIHRYLISLLLTLCALAFPAHAGSETDGLQILTAPEVKYMMEHDKVLVVHALSRIEYNIQHILGSINIPVLEMDSTDKLPADKAYPLIFYCMGSKCAYSKKAAKKALEMGYTQVYWFEGGIPDWNRFDYPLAKNHALDRIEVKKFSPNEVLELLRKRLVYILDVRPLWWGETEATLEGAVFIPLVNLDHDYEKIPKDREIIVIDGAMMQSPSAAKFLIDKGYKVLGVLKGGVLRWEKEGYPVLRRTEELP